MLPEESGFPWLETIAIVVSVIAVLVTVILSFWERSERKSADTKALRVAEKALDTATGARADTRSASLVAVQKSRTRSEYWFGITNNGPAVARNIAIWMTEDGKIVSDKVEVSRDLPQGESETVALSVDGSHPFVGRLVLMAYWDDRHGNEVIVLNNVKPFTS
jgi:hypothetical protein